MQGKTRRFVMNMPEDLAKTLHHLAAVQRVTMSQICVDALADFFARGAMPAMDERYAFRLDRLSKAQHRTENRLTFLIELLGAYAQHQLTLSAHLPPFEPETARLGRARYERLLEFVARRIADGASSRGEES